jgi:membrane-associated phospholipid phosphatase
VLETHRAPRAQGRRVSRPYPPYIWLLSSATLLLAVIAVRWRLSAGPLPGDVWAAHLGTLPKARLIWRMTRAYQQVGRPIVAVLEVVIMLIWLWRAGGRRATQGLLIALLASAVCGLIKTVSGPTPLWISLHHVGSNFPSGVVTFTTATGGYLGAALRRQGRRIAPAALLVIIIGAGPARVLGGQHVLSDALCGYMLGAAGLIAAYAYLAAPDARTVEERIPEPADIPEPEDQRSQAAPATV